MNNYIRFYLFVLGVAGLFAYIGNSIPQISTSNGAVGGISGESPEQLVRAGRAITEGKGSCLVCHSLQLDSTARAPSWEGLGVRAATRKAGRSAAEYLLESLYDPDAFVVEGYPSGQMKPVNRNPIGLTDDEILAVSSYLLNLGGELDRSSVATLESAQEPWRARRESVSPLISPAPDFPAGDPVAGKRLFAGHGCPACHRAPGFQGGEIGPDLSRIGAVQTSGYLFESIVDPSAVIAGGAGSRYAGPAGASLMPPFRHTLTAGEVLDLVAFLQTLTAETE